METIAQDIKIRFNRASRDRNGKLIKKDGEIQREGWRYVLTLAANGTIISSTLNPSRATLFSEEQVKTLSLQTDRLYEDTIIETF